MSEMKIAMVEDLYFRIPRSVWYSFFNSPYTPHRNAAAIDVYFPGEDALYPLEEGVLREIKKINTPHNIEDYLLLFETHGLLLKVLHVKPSIKIGEKISNGESFGRIIYSGYLYPWSNKHAHFEIRRMSDPYRARGGLKLKPLIQPLTPIAIGREYMVMEKQEYYIWVKPLETNGRGLTPLYYNTSPIEGGIPHYNYGAVFGEVEELELMSCKIRVGERLMNNIGLFDTSNLAVKVNGENIKGVGVYCNQPYLKLITSGFEEGEVVELNILC